MAVQCNGWIKGQVFIVEINDTDFKDILVGFARFVKSPEYAKALGRQFSYVYFQDFIPNNDSDIRVVVIGEKAFAGKRMVRPNDFRASGYGIKKYERELFDERCISLAFDYTRRLKAQCVAYDFIFDKSDQPVLLEISFGFDHNPANHPGYWDSSLVWHEEKFNSFGWMVDLVIAEK